MMDLLDNLKNLVLENVGDVEKISDLDGLENLFVIELKNGKKYALSLLELE